MKERKKEEKIQILAIDNMLDNDWRKSIVEYLKNPIGNVARKVKYRALNYVVMGKRVKSEHCNWVIVLVVEKMKPNWVLFV